jgi:hypothetical protein
VQHFFDLKNEWLHAHHADGVRRRRAFYSALRMREQGLFNVQHLMVLHRVGFRYAYPFRNALKIVSAVATTTPSGLLTLALAQDASVIGDHTRFEAIRDFDLSRFMYDIECHDPDERVRKDLERIISFFTKHLFGSGSVDVYVKSEHDPEAHYYVREVEFSEKLFENQSNGVTRYHKLICRPIKDGGFAMLDHRPKDAWSTVFKIFSQQARGKHNPGLVRDRRGLCFIVKDEEYAIQMGARLQSMIESEGGHIYSNTHNFTGETPVDATNACSSKGFRALKIEFRLWASDFELQILTVHGHLTREYATDEVNHEMYRLNQSLLYYLPLIYPSSVYGVDWQDEKVALHLRNIVTSRLGWKLT